MYAHMTNGLIDFLCPLPGWLAALGLSPTELADLNPRGYPGEGYLVVTDDPPPTWDDVTHAARLSAPVIDSAARVARRHWVVEARPDAAERLAARRSSALEDLERQVSTAISAFVPPNRDLAYAEKHRQALLVQTGGAAGQTLTLEASAREIDIPTLAAMVITKAEAWDQALGQIEALRLVLIGRIAEATCGAEINQILSGASWPVP